MAIANYKPTSKPISKPNLPKIEPKAYQGSVIHDEDIPVKSLMAYMEGSPWSVDYYSQVLGQHNDLRELDSTSPNLLQQYQKIANLEIRVSGALSDSYDSATGISTVTGNALTTNVIVPNKGDYFVSETGNSKKGIFRITMVERKTFNRDSAFYLEYDLIGYTDVAVDIYKALEDKTVRSYYFSKDRLIENQQPLLKSEDAEQVLNLKSAYRGLVQDYFKTFFNRSYMTLVLPGQETSIYDSFVVEYLFKIIDSFDAPEIRSIRIVPTDNEQNLSQPQFWTMMLNRDFNNLKFINQKMGLVQREAFNHNSYGKGMAFCNVKYIVYPVVVDDSVKLIGQYPMKTQSIEEVMDTAPFQGSMNDLIDLQYTENTKTYQLHYPIIQDDYYVMSAEFYNQTHNQSVIEILVKDYLKGNTLDLNKLYALINTYKTWKRLEQYYYGPILLTLIKEADRGVYS